MNEKDRKCPDCGSELRCLGGYSAHENNWYCSNEKDCGWEAWSKRREEMKIGDEPVEPTEVYSPHTLVEELGEREVNSFPTIITREGHSVGKTEEYHRSEHNDFATSKELKDRKFSGVRNNSITNSREIWVNGILSASINEEIIRIAPQKWESLYSEVFGLMEVITEGRE